MRDRGLVYFNKGRVAITASSAGEVVARVRGTEKYKVRIRLRGIKLIASCSCPYSGSNGGAPCKHLWATVLAVDARALLPSAPSRPLRLVTEPAPGQARRPEGAENAGPGPYPNGARPGLPYDSGPAAGSNQRADAYPPPRGPGQGYGPGPNQGYGPNGGPGNGRGTYPGPGNGNGNGHGAPPNYGPERELRRAEPRPGQTRPQRAQRRPWTWPRPRLPS